MSEEKLAKILVELPGDDFPSGESMWALPLGDDQFELRNTTWYAFDLHFLDVVRAVPEEEDQLPKVREVVRSSGHKTIRIYFLEQSTDADIAEVLRELNARQANHEHSHGRLYGIDVTPQADYPAVCTYLAAMQQDDLLAYETGMTVEEEGERHVDPPPIRQS